MTGSVFDIDSGELLFKISDDMAIDSKGGFSIRMGDNMVMDMETGDLHFTTGWGTDGSYSKDD